MTRVEARTKTNAALTTPRCEPGAVLQRSDRAVVSPSDGRRARASRPDQRPLELMCRGECREIVETTVVANRYPATLGR